MQKKLTAQGPKNRKSYTVTLPIEWVKQEGLNKIRSVELTVVGRKVIISADKPEENKVLVKAAQYNLNLIKVLQSLYRSGVDEIMFVSDSKMMVEASDIIERCLIGYEIIDQKKDHMIIKDITRESEDDFKVILRRVFLQIIELTNSTDELSAKSLHKNVKKLINYCQRILMKKGHSEFAKTPIYYLMLDRLEKISDEWRWLLELGIDKQKKSRREEELAQIFREAYELFHKFDPNRYNKYQYRTYELKNEIKLRDQMDKATIHLHNLARILNSLYGDIFMLRFSEN